MNIKQIRKDCEARPKRLLLGTFLYNDEDNNVRRNRREEISKMFDEAFADEIREMNAKAEYEKKELDEFMKNWCSCPRVSLDLEFKKQRRGTVVIALILIGFTLLLLGL